MSRSIPWLGLANFAGDFPFKTGPLLACFITVTTNFYCVLACSDAVHGRYKSTNQWGASHDPASSQEITKCPKIWGNKNSSCLALYRQLQWRLDSVNKKIPTGSLLDTKGSVKVLNYAKFRDLFSPCKCI